MRFRVRLELPGRIRNANSGRVQVGEESFYWTARDHPPLAGKNIIVKKELHNAIL